MSYICVSQVNLCSAPIPVEKRPSRGTKRIRPRKRERQRAYLRSTSHIPLCQRTNTSEQRVFPKRFRQRSWKWTGRLSFSTDSANCRTADRLWCYFHKAEWLAFLRGVNFTSGSRPTTYTSRTAKNAAKMLRKWREISQNLGNHELIYKLRWTGIVVVVLEIVMCSVLICEKDTIGRFTCSSDRCGKLDFSLYAFIFVAEASGSDSEDAPRLIVTFERLLSSWRKLLCCLNKTFCWYSFSQAESLWWQCQLLQRTVATTIPVVTVTSDIFSITILFCWKLC